jgi:hypothetical protein
MSLQLDNFRLAYHNLERRVRTSINTQAGNPVALNPVRDECLGLLAAAQLVRDNILSHHHSVMVYLDYGSLSA